MTVFLKNHFNLTLKVKDMKSAQEDLTGQVKVNMAQLCVFGKRIENE